MEKKTLKLVVGRDIGIYDWGVTVGRYMKELAILRRKREGQPIISDCIKEMRQELEKYDYLRSVSHPIDSFINYSKKNLTNTKKKPPRSKDV